MKTTSFVFALAAVLALSSPTPGQGGKTPPDLQALGAELKAAVKRGELTEEQATAKYHAAVKAAKAKAKTKTKSTAKQDLEALGRKLRAAVDAGKMTGAEAKAAYQRAAKKAGGEKMSGKDAMRAGKGKRSNTFYAILIGRLKSKDVELGEFELDVDHITSIHGDRSQKARLVGKTVKVVGVSGPWLDKLLLIKKGETLKVRSMSLTGTTVTLSPKATVLEKARPFAKDAYPIPPESFRGFRGTVTGKIVQKTDQGYELVLRVQEVVEVGKDSTAKDPKSIVGRLLQMQGFYDAKYRATFDSLAIGDRIRVGAAHATATEDSVDTAGTLEKVGAK